MTDLVVRTTVMTDLVARTTGMTSMMSIVVLGVRPVAVNPA